MTSTHPSSSGDPGNTWEPALSQLRALSPADLDRLAAAWLARSGCKWLRRCEPLERNTTYHGVLSRLPLPVSLRLRIHQRRRRLHVHHVEAFAGHLLRAGASHGILVTTGSVTPAARAIADSYRQVRLRLYTGPEWAAELASWHLGLRHRPFWHWVLSRPLTGPFCPRDRGKRQEGK